MTPRKTLNIYNPESIIPLITFAITVSLSQTGFALSPCVVTNTLDYDLTTNPPSPASGSLRAAIECVKNDPLQDTISFSIGTTNPVITLTSQGDLVGFTPALFSYLQIDTDTTIIGPTTGDPASVTIQGNNHRIFLSNASLTLENMTLTRGNTSAEPGGAIYITSQVSANIPLTLTLKNSRITDSHVKSSHGGAIAAENTLVILDGSSIANNSADGDFYDPGAGGGIHSGGYMVTLKNNSSISGNSTSGETGNGGGIFSYDDVLIKDSTVSGNSTQGIYSEGGGIWTDSKLTLDNSTVTGNSTIGDDSPGGGINARLKVVITGSSITKNTTSGNTSPGGGIRANSQIEINQSTIADNSTIGSDSPGGGVFIEFGNYDQSTIRQSTISNNSTKGVRSPGGGLSTLQGHPEIYNSTISGNFTDGEASNGGGISATSMLFSQSTLSGNSVNNGTSSGGGAYLEGYEDYIDTPPPIYEKATQIIQSTITNNEAPDDSVGGIWIRTIESSHSATISNTIISGNRRGTSEGNLIFSTSINTNKISFINSIIGDPESLFTNVMDSSTTDSFFGTQVALFPLNDNGGPTKTHLLDTSNTNIAVDAGDNTLAPATFDQRGTGFDRIINTTVDIGSTEAGAASPPTPIPAVCVPD